ncbi:hypothetical protein [Streptomyces sp. NPDC054962]
MPGRTVRPSLAQVLEPLLERARHVAGHRPTAAATLAAAVAARAYALNHQSEQARDALEAADALMDQLPESERSETWLTYGEQKHHVHLSHAFTTLGDTRLAHVTQERALELSAPTSTMTRTLLNIDAATCSHHDGDTEQACHRTVTGPPGGQSRWEARPEGVRRGLRSRCPAPIERGWVWR